jgi:hypothetical protein
MKYVYLLRVRRGRRYILVGVFADDISARERAEAQGYSTLLFDIEQWEVESSLPVSPAEQPDACPHAPRADVSPNVAEDADRPDILII